MPERMADRWAGPFDAYTIKVPPLPAETRRHATCSEHNPSRSCPHRYAAVRAGTFHYNYDAGGWLWAESKSPLIPWLRCPWCWKTLPTLERAIDRLLSAPINDE